MGELKTITGRKSRQGAPEESLAPGGSVRIKKRNGKIFELKRVDGGPRSITKYMGRLFKEVPIDGPRQKVDLVKMFLEDRE